MMWPRGALVIVALSLFTAATTACSSASGRRSARRVGGDRSAVHDGRRRNRARSRPEGRQSRRDGDPELERAQARRGE